MRRSGSGNDWEEWESAQSRLRVSSRLLTMAVRVAALVLDPRKLHAYSSRSRFEDELARACEARGVVLQRHLAAS